RRAILLAVAAKPRDQFLDRNVGPVSPLDGYAEPPAGFTPGYFGRGRHRTAPPRAACRAVPAHARWRRANSGGRAAVETQRARAESADRALDRSTGRRI